MEPSDFFGQQRFVKRWISLVLAVTAGCGGAVLGWLAAPEWQIAATVIAFLAGFAGMSFFIILLRSFYTSLASSVNYQMNHLMNRIYQSEQELSAMINIRPLLEDSLTGFDGWAVDARFAEQLLLFINEKRREPASTGVIVECGSGTSTVVAARYLKQTGFGEILSLEHDERFAAVTRQALRDAGLVDIATVLTAPENSEGFRQLIQLLLLLPRFMIFQLLPEIRRTWKVQELK